PARRALRWLQRLGLEWLYRLFRQPWRWRRMASRLPCFVLAVLWRGSRPPRGFEGIGGRYG
ncbi:MAG: WecB/TagA/CpsF family glycosyltransferase, partial [Chloroflexi bacterium]|nr:WecB/TagA/CpsF family glycosyltransferase [Chloroflexota bacterium]